MQKVFEKIIEKLEAEKFCYFLTIANTGDKSFDVAYEKVGEVIDKAIEIVKQEEADIPIIHGKEELKEHDKIIYNQAIDDFAEKAKEMANTWWRNSCIYMPEIDQIAEKLKKV